jgi:hypothetical protein
MKECVLIWVGLTLEFKLRFFGKLYFHICMNYMKGVSVWLKIISKVKSTEP